MFLGGLSGVTYVVVVFKFNRIGEIKQATGKYRSIKIYFVIGVRAVPDLSKF